MPRLNIIRKLAAWLLVALLYACAVTWLVRKLELATWAPGNEAAAALTAVLGTLIVFRNNAAYDRWWEARKLWGTLNNEIRNFALKVHAHVSINPEELQEFERLLSAFPHALRLHLRGAASVRTVPRFEKELTSFTHAPGYIAGLVHQSLDRWNREGRLKDSLWILDHHARALMEVCGGCERIRTTPLASSYRALLRIGMVLYVLLAPWAVAMEIGWWAPLVLGVGMVFLIGLELTGEAVEEPFGQEGDDLPLETYCDSIERFVRQALGSADQPSDSQTSVEPL
jgi:putative membrane protein